MTIAFELVANFNKKIEVIVSDVLYEILNEYKKFTQTKAVAIGGSSSAKTSDSESDIDIYVFVKEDIPLEPREKLVKKISVKYEVGGEYFGLGDEFFVDKLNKQLDIMFWNAAWFEDTICNIWEKFRPSNCYTTCFLYTLSNFNIIYDSNGWLQNLKKKINTEYPKQLQQNIIKRNMMLLKDKPFASYYEQIKKALQRNDLNSINHRVTAFLASYFDIIFAVNKLFHPGEKRLIQFCINNCKILPQNFENNINKILTQPNQDTLKILDEIVENLRETLPV